MVGPLTGADEDLGVPTINVKNIDGGPLGGVRVGDLEAPTLNTKKR
jgi:hypothetical protein